MNLEEITSFPFFDIDEEDNLDITIKTFRARKCAAKVLEDINALYFADGDGNNIVNYTIVDKNENDYVELSIHIKYSTIYINSNIYNYLMEDEWDETRLGKVLDRYGCCEETKELFKDAYDTCDLLFGEELSIITLLYFLKYDVNDKVEYISKSIDHF